MPKLQPSKLKGASCNIPIYVVGVRNTLPRPANSGGIVTVKLKRKLQYRDHVYFRSVTPNFNLRLLQYLKLINLFYHDFAINLDNLPNFLINEKSQCSLHINVLINIKIN